MDGGSRTGVEYPTHLDLDDVMLPALDKSDADWRG